MNDKVECRSDIAYAGEPMVIFPNGIRKPVLQVVASWRSPQEIGYRVMTNDLEIYDCLYSEAADNWTIIKV